MKLSDQCTWEFLQFLRREEKSTATQEKYLRDVNAFRQYAHGKEITKELVVAWKKRLSEGGYTVCSVNSMLAGVNCLLDFLGLADILGHSSIDTTRIYIMTTGLEHRRRIERLGLVL